MAKPVVYRAHNEPSGWSRQCINRDRLQWPYALLESDQFGRRIIETVHGSIPSLRMEVEVTANRIREAKPNLGGQIPTTIDVDGLAEAEWKVWTNGQCT